VNNTRSIHYDSLKSLGKNKNIPWNENKNIIEARKVLQKMFDSVPNGSLFSKYLYDNCKWLLLPLKGDTNIVCNDNKNTILTTYPLYNVNNNKNSFYHPKDFAGMAGCYVFTNTITDQQYVGSSIDIYTRFKDHVVNSSNKTMMPTPTPIPRGGNSPFYASVTKHGWSNFTWRPVIISLNHSTEFYKQNISPAQAIFLLNKTNDTQILPSLNTQRVLNTKIGIIIFKRYSYITIFFSILSTYL
jgi:hypothetical protein